MKESKGYIDEYVIGSVKGRKTTSTEKLIAWLMVIIAFLAGFVSQ